MTLLEAHEVAFVLDDCASQIAVLGLASLSIDRKIEATEAVCNRSYLSLVHSINKVVGDEITRIIIGQRQLEKEYDAVRRLGPVVLQGLLTRIPQLLTEREEIKSSNAAQSKFDANDEAIRRVARQLRESTEVSTLAAIICRYQHCAAVVPSPETESRSSRERAQNPRRAQVSSGLHAGDSKRASAKEQLYGAPLD